jgi:hypothetical protein
MCALIPHRPKLTLNLRLFQLLAVSLLMLDTSIPEVSRVLRIRGWKFRGAA